MSDAAPGRGWTGYEPAGPDDRPPEPDAPFADAIVVAAGASSRMGGIDKLDADVAGVPLLAHSLTAIGAAPEVRQILLVTTNERVEQLAGAGWLPPKLILVVTGGRRRQDSVRSGFEQLIVNPFKGGTDAEVILVHDGARPLVPTSLVSAVAHAARIHGAAIPVLPLGDTIKRLDRGGTVSGAGDRSTLGAAQTPQGVRTELLREAFRRFPSQTTEVFTDEAALLEACRLPVHAIPGDERNFKVTLPADLARVRTAFGMVPSTAEKVPASATTRVRVGFGNDSHPFGPGTDLALGGLAIPGAPRLHGHSDGDVVLHAIADALLGAAGLGDLGRVFPAGPETPAGIASLELVAEVVARVRATGHEICGLDCTIVAARPRLAGLLPAMGARIAELLAIDPSSVNVKASTGNLDGMEGAGRGISVTAVVVLAAGTGDR